MFDATRLTRATIALLALAVIGLFTQGCKHSQVNDPHAINATDFLSQDPQESLDRLVEGNTQLVQAQEHGRTLDIDLLTARAGKQKPYAALVACADSRSGPEIVFDAGYSELFVCRLAGNVASGYTIASTEYAVKVLGTRLIVVMGHTSCGAVDAAIKGVNVTPEITNLVSSIKPAVEIAQAEGTAKTQVLQRAIVVNAFLQKARLLKNSEFLRSEHAAGRIKIVVCVQDLNTAQVIWTDLDGLRGPVTPPNSVFAAPDAAKLKQLAEAVDSGELLQPTGSLSMKASRHDHAGHGH